ncbi:hypothetical protein [Olivibacter sitiensis]|uniref:hypothetical protein n=1 Tax=Olivibacter sitiensis TaxID=376470 RepID=UPI0004890C6A|nr:hypothetical protein [Olivibacter sitiensis]
MLVPRTYRTLSKLQLTAPILILAAFLFFSCSKSDDLQEPEQTYAAREKEFLKAFREKVRGDWKVERLVIKKGYKTQATGLSRRC